MANRRMFSKGVVQSSKFLRMPATSRLLYYDFGMAADDDGYCEWFSVLQMSGAKEQDMQVLEANGFVQIFDRDVLVIRDWKENNLIKSDRYTPSKYLGKYPEFQLGTQAEPQVRLGKDISTASLSAKTEEVVEVRVDNEGSELRRASKKAVASYRAMTEWAAERRGFPFISLPKQYAAFKKAKEAGLTKEDLKTRWIEMENEEYWKRSGFDWAAVVSSFDRRK